MGESGAISQLTLSASYVPLTLARRLTSFAAGGWLVWHQNIFRGKVSTQNYFETLWTPLGSLVVDVIKTYIFQFFLKSLLLTYFLQMIAIDPITFSL